MKTANKNFYAFVGQNATTGSPHPITRRLNMFGDIVAFSSKAKRDQFVNEYYNQANPSQFAAKTNKHTAKSDYCAGMSKYNYDEYLQGINYNVDASFNSYFNFN